MRRFLVVGLLLLALTTLACAQPEPTFTTTSESEPSPAASPTSAPAATPEPAASATPVPTATPSSTPHPSPTAAPTPMAQPTPTATGDPTLTPTTMPVPTPTPRRQTYRGLRFNQYGAPPLITIDAGANYVATIHTNKGEIVVELFPKSAPKTVNNFVFLAQEGFYDGLVFHRVIENFMIQGGDPTGTGGAGPGYKFEDEIDAEVVFDRPGRLAMANAGPNTNGSQFFITTVPTPFLDGAHTIFGQVVEGQAVAEAISKVPRDQADRPTQPVTIETIQIAKTGA